VITFNIHGLTLTVIPKKTPASGPARTLMVKSATDSNRPHVQRLFVPEGQWDREKTTIAPLPSEKGEWRPEFGDGTVAWELAGAKLLVPHVEQTIHADDTAVQEEYPDGSDASWHSLQWVVDANELLPSARLKDDYRTLGRGDKIATEVVFAGGRVRGQRPLGQGGHWVWFVRPRMKLQAITDCMAVECSTPDIDGLLRLDVQDGSGTTRGVIAIRDGAQVFLVNEMKGTTPASKPRPTMPDLGAYFAAFDADLKHKQQVDPVALYPFPVDTDVALARHLIDTDYCIGGLVRE
jgi:hypothetical protein